MRLKKSDDSVVYSITDTGPGIAQEEQKRIFAKFYQVDSSHREEGNGLGLALVNRIVAASGGTITVESEPGAGACFIVRLPLSVEGTMFNAEDNGREDYIQK